MVTHDVVGQPTLRILVADDNRDAADAMCMLLQVSGYEALACYDGKLCSSRFSVSNLMFYCKILRCPGSTDSKLPGVCVRWMQIEDS